jgi:hypothetical protein
LNRAGTQLAIVWSESGSTKTRNDTFQPVLDKQKLTATELTGSPRARALKQFQSGKGWHRADAVDQLSEEESSIITARILRRVQAKTPLTEAKATMLRSALTDALKERFLRPPGRPSRTPEQERNDILKKTADYLNETELGALRDAFASGLRPLPGEP